ncbi:hypothetical protein PVAP13_7NG002317 [Panicum virgatum]|uniref:Uncharacterized protein n=1 Tax=Panicum virgatum TaxID=38727 RepID=A0A8T0Q249_PANVG|nr:hypothetical protein PVAP13_7NG002317 [Panicum virgatum]
MHCEVKNHFNPGPLDKRMPTDALLASKFYTCLSDSTKTKIKLPSNYDRTLIRASQK